VISNDWMSIVSYWSVLDIPYIYMLLSQVQSFFIHNILLLGSAILFLSVSVYLASVLCLLVVILCNRDSKAGIYQLESILCCSVHCTLFVLCVPLGSVLLHSSA
jgi:hypothetical protein